MSVHKVSVLLSAGVQTTIATPGTSSYPTTATNVGKLPATVYNLLSARTVPRHSAPICSLSSTNPRPSP